jgi:hypothetical protein
MTHNKAAVDLIAARLATGLIHPGDPDTGRPPTPILLPGLSTTGIPPEMAEDFAQIAGLPTNDAPKLLAEAIVALIETELAGGSTIVTDADLAALQQAAATAPTGARILSVHQQRPHHRQRKGAVDRAGATQPRLPTRGEHLMAHMRITIDGETVMDDTLDAWSAEPPKILRDQLAANSTPKLFMRCLLLVLADSAVTQADTDITITTDEDDDWTMAVIRP